MPKTDNLQYQALRFIDAYDGQMTEKGFIEFFEPIGQTLFRDLWHARLVGIEPLMMQLLLTEEGKKALAFFVEEESREHEQLVARINAIYDCIADHQCSPSDSNLAQAERLIGEWLGELQGPEPDE